MNRLVTIEQRVGEDDHLLGVSARWEPYAEAWCAIETKPGAEPLEEDRRESYTQRVLRMTWSTKLAGVDTQMRVKLPDGRVGGITSVEDVGDMHRELRITCMVKG